MKKRRLLVSLWLLTPALLLAQSGGLDPAAQLHPPTDSWPTYSGDLTGRRYSALPSINKANVKTLSLAWVARGFIEGSGATGRSGPTAVAAGAAGGGRGAGPAYPLLVSGLGPGDYNTGGPPSFRGSIVMLDGVL